MYPREWAVRGKVTSTNERSMTGSLKVNSSDEKQKQMFTILDDTNSIR